MSKRSQLLIREPHWRMANAGARRFIPSDARSWIYESASLTARLRASCREAFNLRVVGQSWRRPFYGESLLLGLPARRYALVREVLLCDGGQPLIMARSVMPPQVLAGAGARLARLGARPLGEILFSYKGLRRDQLDFAQLPSLDWQAEVAEFAEGEAVWGRRSLYRVADGPVLVCEFFLPNVLLY